MPGNRKELVLTVLESVARPRDAEFYLKLFRELPRRSFALIAAEADVLESGVSSVVSPIRFLNQLELFPVVAANLFPQGTSETQGSSFPARLVRELEQSGVSARALNGDSAYLADQVGLALDEGTVPVIDFGRAADRIASLEQLLNQLQTRKMALLRAAGGLGPKERGLIRLGDSHQLLLSDRGISVINLRSDFQLLEQGAVLDDDERNLLRLVKRLQDACPRLSTSITSPLNLLSELFSVKGAGTLVKTGSTISRFERYTEIDPLRLGELLERTFTRNLRPEFWNRPILHVYVEHEYRGAAIVQPGPAALGNVAFLTKFAVDRAAQGEGMGRDLWEAVTRDYPSLYWRSRVENPVLPWYQAQCEGMQRELAPSGAEWQVFWRGVATNNLSAVISDAVNRPVDFDPQTASEVPA